MNTPPVRTHTTIQKVTVLVYCGFLDTREYLDLLIESMRAQKVIDIDRSHRLKQRAAGLHDLSELHYFEDDLEREFKHNMYRSGYVYVNLGYALQHRRDLLGSSFSSVGALFENFANNISADKWGDFFKYCPQLMPYIPSKESFSDGYCCEDCDGEYESYCDSHEEQAIYQIAVVS